MVFCRSFPKTVKGQNYPQWIDMYLNKEEEKEENNKARLENMEILENCIEDAKKVFKAHKLKEFQTDIVCVAIAMFEKLASHAAYHKEERARYKFDMIFKHSVAPKKQK